MYTKSIIQNEQENYPMKNLIGKASLVTLKIDRQIVQLIITIIILSLLVLGAGAPTGGGDTLPGVGA